MLQEYYLNKKIVYLFFFLYKVLNWFIIGFLLKNNIIYLFIKQNKLLFCLSFLKFNSITNTNSLLDIVVNDNINNVLNRFEITYHFWNIIYEIRICLKIHISGLIPIYSVSNIFESGLWLEKEVWDMYGIKFLFHNGLNRILTDYGFKGYPLRKDFPLTGYLDIIYDEINHTIKFLPLELSQHFRLFSFSNSWNNNI
jgi:NADH-quinone oxidoreductase subunit C